MPLVCRPFHQHPNRRQAKTRWIPCSRGEKELACKLSIASVEDHGEGKGRTVSLSEMQEVADGDYRAQVILVSSPPLPLYLCRLRLSPGRSSRRQSHEQISRHQKAVAAGLIRGQLNAYPYRKRSWAKVRTAARGSGCSMSKAREFLEFWIQNSVHPPNSEESPALRNAPKS
jgi:hypothetical protein